MLSDFPEISESIAGNQLSGESNYDDHNEMVSLFKGAARSAETPEEYQTLGRTLLDSYEVGDDLGSTFEEEMARKSYATRMSEPAKIAESVLFVPHLYNEQREQEAVNDLQDGDPLEALRLGSTVEGEVLGEELHDLTGPGIVEFYQGKRYPMAAKMTAEEITDAEMKLELDAMTKKINTDTPEGEKLYKEKHAELEAEKKKL